MQISTFNPKTAKVHMAQDTSFTLKYSMVACYSTCNTAQRESTNTSFTLKYSMLPTYDRANTDTSSTLKYNYVPTICQREAIGSCYLLKHSKLPTTHLRENMHRYSLHTIMQEVTDFELDRCYRCQLHTKMLPGHQLYAEQTAAI